MSNKLFNIDRTMKISAFSDIHGDIVTPLKNIQKSDLVLICGDIFPLRTDRNVEESERWFIEKFIPFIDELPANKVVLISGNHDFFFDKTPTEIVRQIISKTIVSEKLVYLKDDTYEYNGLKIFGTPWITNLFNWAFNTVVPDITFDKIPYDTDILVCHQPPKIGKVGCSYPNEFSERDFGSPELTSAIYKRENIKYVFCGHVHTGIHGGVDFGNCKIYNVSIKDERYVSTFNVTEIEI